jgi:hypothetical protein
MNQKKILGPGQCAGGGRPEVKRERRSVGLPSVGDAIRPENPGGVTYGDAQTVTRRERAFLNDAHSGKKLCLTMAPE